ncbi:hypothetical protein [Mangrovicoccus algicola]|uniref:DUF4157 domain-containing protein n=1 Tax=Mangrovicoccus algicola TaxID=2771008 RepID=A0A8J7D0Z1_9RHOB|nr:hypothetical protein [Mangrovicoccus algicola]MBE3640138.1 hypothetical protein [Mangrovicoccus algicola]
MRSLLLIAALALAGCATRPLTGTETAFLATTHGPGLDASRISLTKGAIIGRWPITRPARPAVTCREKIWPPEEGEVTGHAAGVTVFDRILIARRIHAGDYLPDYPDTLPLPQAMFLAHEATHVWQWQHRATTGYAPWKAAAEHGVSDDPYLFEIAPGRDFLDYGYEQQASLVEEYVCCRALDPEGARTGRLRALLARYFPGMADHESARRIALPWNGVEAKGICS